MTNDPGGRERRPRRPNLTLPRVIDVVARRTGFDPPKLRNFTSALTLLDDTVEFVVETDGPIPVRALGPVLWIGDSQVTEVRADDETHYVFLSLQPEELKEGQPIGLGWSGQTERLETGRTFESPR